MSRQYILLHPAAGLAQQHAFYRAYRLFGGWCAWRTLQLLIDRVRNNQLARMGELGRNRVVNELVWQYEARKLLAAYADLWR